jgi:hypothetical protein
VFSIAIASKIAQISFSSIRGEALSHTKMPCDCPSWIRLARTSGSVPAPRISISSAFAQISFSSIRGMAPSFTEMPK